MRRSKAFNSQTTALFRNATPGIPIDQLIQYYKNGINQTRSNLSTGTPSIINPDFYLYGDLERVAKMKRRGFSIPFLVSCVRNPYRHQWRLNLFDAIRAARAIYRLNLPGAYSSFDELYEAISREVLSIPRIGRSTIYDAALRIGHTMSLEPDEFVYIHETLRKCAETIIGQPIPKNTYKIPRIKFDNAYPGFGRMPSMEIEDFICIYKDVI